MLSYFSLSCLPPLSLSLSISTSLSALYPQKQEPDNITLLSLYISLFKINKWFFLSFTSSYSSPFYSSPQFLLYIALSSLSLVYFSFLYSLYLLPPQPPQIKRYSSSLITLFRNDAGKTTNTLKHTHTTPSSLLSPHSLSVLLSSCFIFLVPYSISITLFEMGKVGKDMYHCVLDLYSVLGCVVRPGGRGWRWKVKVRM